MSCITGLREDSNVGYAGDFTAVRMRMRESSAEAWSADEVHLRGPYRMVREGIAHDGDSTIREAG